jgi:non-specific serine/threonine protein kinase/serine/threonine-protein kinase
MRQLDFARVKSIFCEAVNRDPAERVELLNRACGDDSELRHYVQGLLDRDDAGHTAVGNGTGPQVRKDPWIGRRLGPYELREHIASGGMGDVYRAVRTTDFPTDVAVKLAQRARVFEDLARRFRDEIRFQAALGQHPHIAAIRDAGQTEEGVPYFVMDYVDGVRIDEYCDTRRLNANARIALFRQVCDAVQFAHQNTVIHRDLKPSNILVTKNGAPVLIDFGVAKLADQDAATDVTGTSWGAFTPAYASPEQLRRETVSTATDVYSLGVILYELLTGHHPHAGRTKSSEIERSIVEDVPPRPSEMVARCETVAVNGSHEDTKRSNTVCLKRGTTPPKLRRILLGDLDTILLTALQKDPARRYATVEQFSDDLRRHAVKLPIRARPDHWAYRARKFVRRNRAMVVVGALLASSLVAGTVGTTLFALRAERQRKRAQAHFDDVRNLANTFLLEFHDQIRDLPGATPAAKKLIDTSLQYLKRLEQDTDLKPQDSLWLQIADGYLKLGEIQGQPGKDNLGNRRAGEASFRRAREMAEAALQMDPKNTHAILVLTHALGGIASLDLAEGKLSEALATIDRALKQMANSAGAPVDDPKWISELFALHYKLFNVNWRRGDLVRARSALEQAIAVIEPCAAEPDQTKMRENLAVALVRLGHLQAVQGDPNSAMKTCQRGQVLLKELVTVEPTSTAFRRNLAIANDQLARLHLQREEPEPALAYYSANVTLFQALIAADPSNVHRRRDVMIATQRLGDLLIELDRPREALAKYEASEQLSKTLWDITGSFEDKRDYVINVERVARAQSASNQLDQAIPRQRRVVELRQVLHEERPDHEPTQQDLAFSWDRLADMLSRKDQLQEALEALKESLRHRRELLKSSPERPGSVRRVADNLVSLGALLAKLNHHEDAVKYLEDGLAMYRHRGLRAPDDQDPKLGLAHALHRAGTTFDSMALIDPTYREKAQSAYKETIEILKSYDGDALSSDNRALLRQLSSSANDQVP